jgi:putative PIN family toxin of toxin-antitoxin system
LLVVVDAMVWVSATMGHPRSASRFIYHAFKRGDFECVTSGPLIDEMARVLVQEFEIPGDVVEDLVRLLCALAKVVSIKHQVMGCTDANDDPVLETAVTGAASVIVTRDAKLLNLPPHVDAYFRTRGIDIETPADFCRRLRALPKAPAT